MKKQLPFFTLCACLILQISLVAQTTYTFTGTGNWNNNNAANWSPSVPPNPLNSGHIVIAGNCTITANTRRINSGATLTIQPGATLTIPLDKTLRVEGDFNNSGSIIIEMGGRILQFGMFNNNAAITNNGEFSLSGSSANFNNTSTGTLINNMTVTVGNGSTLVNSASGQIMNNSGATLTVTNNGILINNGLLNNAGTVDNNNTITNTGTFNNNSGGVLNNGNHSGDLFDNTGTLNNNTGATINNYLGATINTTTGAYTNSGTYTGAAPLPIELLSFTGKVQNEHILLKWETASEKENAYMAVERSRDGIHFQEIGRRKGAGTTSARQTYTMIDTTPFFGINYYRLRQVDNDNKPTYHDVIAIEFGGKIKETMRLYPTQTSQDITIVSQTLPASGSTLQIFDASGKLVQQKPWDTEATQQTVNVSALPSGTYFITLRSGKNLQTLRFMRL